MAGVIDVLPTVCGLAGVPVPDDRTLDGRAPGAEIHQLESTASKVVP